MSICVAFPVETNDISALKVEIDEILKLNPNFIEFRLDYLKEFHLISDAFLKELLGCLNKRVPAIFTLRDPEEGGKMEIDDDQRWRGIEKMINAHPDYIDLEMISDNESLKNAINNAIIQKVNIIFSFHDFESTPLLEDIYRIFDIFKDKVEHLYVWDSKIVEKSVIKMVFVAKDIEDNVIPMKFCKELSSNNQKVISFCMGELGIMSRVSCLKAGSFLTFASYKEKTAPGQLHINSIRDLLDSIS